MVNPLSGKLGPTLAAAGGVYNVASAQLAQIVQGVEAYLSEERRNGALHYSIIAGAAALDLSTKLNWVPGPGVVMVASTALSLDNGVDEDAGYLVVKQDATGGRALTLTAFGRTVVGDYTPDVEPGAITRLGYVFGVVDGVSTVLVAKIKTPAAVVGASNPEIRALRSGVNTTYTEDFDGSMNAAWRWLDGSIQTANAGIVVNSTVLTKSVGSPLDPSIVPSSPVGTIVYSLARRPSWLSWKAQVGGNGPGLLTRPIALAASASVWFRMYSPAADGGFGGLLACALAADSGGLPHPSQCLFIGLDNLSGSGTLALRLLAGYNFTGVGAGSFTLNRNISFHYDVPTLFGFRRVGPSTWTLWIGYESGFSLNIGTVTSGFVVAHACVSGAGFPSLERMVVADNADHLPW